MRLVWDSIPKVVLLVKKSNDDSVTHMLDEVARWLTEVKKLSILVEPKVNEELPHWPTYPPGKKKWENSFHFQLLTLKILNS
jgi:hypothetical protein